MENKYCQECGAKLVIKELENEGMVPFCPGCGQFRFPMYNVAVSMIVADEQSGKILLIQQYGRPAYILVAGYVNRGEQVEHAAVREIKEETGLTVTEYRYRGIVTFISDVWETEYMHLFTVTGFRGEVSECDEGDLEWIDVDRLLELPMWEGDRIFLNLLASDSPFFSLKLKYEGEKLSLAVLNGKKMGE